MTKKIKVKFTIATQYVKSGYSETKEFEVEDNATEQEIEEEIDSDYREWLLEHNYGGWSIVESE